MSLRQAQVLREASEVLRSQPRDAAESESAVVQLQIPRS